MNQRVKYLFKNLSLLTISNFSSKILVFLMVPLYTSVLTTEEYGTFDLGISTISLLFPILTLNIVDGVLRFSMDKENSIEDIAFIGLKSILISIILSGIIIAILDMCGIFKEIGIYLFFYYFSYSFNQLLIQFSKGIDKIIDMAVAGIIGTLSMVVFNIVFLIVFKVGFKGFFWANILAQMVPALYLFIRVRFWKYIIIHTENKKLKKEMLIYSVPLIATALGWWVNNTLDKYAVTFMFGLAANGILSVAYKIPSIINSVQSIFTQAWQISAIREYGEQDTAIFYGKTYSIVNMVMCAVCAWLILLTRPLASVLYSKDFYSAWVYVPFLLISSVLNCASGLLGPILSAKKNTKTMMWSAIIGAVFNAFFNIVLLYFIGIQGATIATMISSIVIYVVRRIGVGKEIQIKDKYYLTWFLLVLEASVEIIAGNRLIELLLMLIMLIVNWSLIKEAKGYFVKR